MKSPAVVHFAKWPLEIFDKDLKARAIERDAAGEGLVDELVGDRHVGDDDVSALGIGRSLAHPQRPA